MNNKKKYIAFCNELDVIPFFYEPAWWDTLSPQWDVVHFTVAGTDFFIPYILERKLFFTFIRNPHFTPYSGLFYNFSLALSNEDLLTAWNMAIHCLPKAAQLQLDCYPSAFPNIPKATVKRTHLLPITSKDDLYQSLKPALKRQLKKAEKNLHIIKSKDLDPLLELHAASLKRQKSMQPVDAKLAKALFDYSIKNTNGHLYYCKDIEGNIHAGLWVVYDQQRMYYLLGGSQPDFLGSGAMGLLLWTAIQSCMDLRIKQFDFEGSDIDGIARFFKTFGAQEVFYPVLSKPTNKILSVLQRIKKA